MKEEPAVSAAEEDVRQHQLEDERQAAFNAGWSDALIVSKKRLQQRLASINSADESSDDDSSAVDVDNDDDDDKDYLPASEDLSTDLSESSADQDTVPRRGGKKTGKRTRAPLPGNDPDSPSSGDSDNDDDPEDRWTDKLRRLPPPADFAAAGPHGPTFETSGKRKVDFFFEYFPLLLISKIVSWTNLSDISPKTSIGEMRAWIGCVLVMGVSHANNYYDYWSEREGLRNILIFKTITRHRFESISSHLTCSDPASSPEIWPTKTSKQRAARWIYMKLHPLYPVQELWDTVVLNCRMKWNAARELAIDEAMVLYKGCRSICKKFYMPTKPIRAGFKMYAIAESITGYVLNFEVHRDLGRRQSMVEISMSVIRPFLGKFHHIFCDRLYTSVELAKTLYQQATYLTGAIRSSARDLPADLSSNPKKNLNFKGMLDMKFTPRGTFYARQRIYMTYVVWKDSSLLPLLSTLYQGFRNKVRDIIQRRFAKDGERFASHSIPAPPSAVAYTKYKGGVDLADQLRAYSTCARKSNTWWKQLFYFLIDVSRTNAWISYKHTVVQELPELAPGARRKGPCHSHFIIDVATELIDGFSEGEVRVVKQNPSAVPVPGYNGGNHHCVRMTHMGLYPRHCIHCKRLGKKTRSGKSAISSSYGCATCNVYLCRFGCFTEFHLAAGVAQPLP